MATVSMQSIYEVIDQYITFKRKGSTITEVRQISDKELRKHIASEASIRDYELSKDVGLIGQARSKFMR